MITDALKAWVLHKYWSGDTSARVIFFTLEYGVVNCLYKGGRTPKKQAMLQAFTPLWLTMDMRGEACFVRQLEIAAPTVAFTGDKLFAALYMNELLYYALKPFDSVTIMHEIYPQALEALQKAPDRYAMEAVLRRFEWTLVRACGYSMSFTEDASSAQAIVAQRYYHFVLGKGFIAAEEGIQGAHILALSEDRLDDPQVLKLAKRIMRMVVDDLIDGREIKSRALYSR